MFCILTRAQHTLFLDDLGADQQGFTPRLAMVLRHKCSFDMADPESKIGFLEVSAVKL